MKKFLFFSFSLSFLLCAKPVFAQSQSSVEQFSHQTSQTLIILASLGSVIFLIKGGYLYITSTGKPEVLDQAKRTIRNAVIGLVLVLSAGILSNLLMYAWNPASVTTGSQTLQLQPITPVKPQTGLTQVLLDALNGLLHTIVQSATKPLVDGIISLLTTTPPLATNSVIFNFWLTMVGIVDTLFVLLIAVLGLQFMSASSFGYEEMSLQHLFSKISISFLGANSSLFLVDWIINVNNALIQTILATTGGIDKAWVLQAVNITNNPGEIALITLIFMLLYVILCVVLVLFYITRLITLALGAVLSPFIFLLWALPKFSDFAEITTKAYIINITSVFVHVVIIQLSAAFFTLPEQSGTNSFLSLLMGIGLLFMLLKTSSFMLQLMFYNTGRGMMRSLGRQLINVITTKKEERFVQQGETHIHTPRKVVQL